jgi:hypothetical protein
LKLILQPRSALNFRLSDRTALLLKFLPQFPLNLIGAGLVHVAYVGGNLEVRVNLSEITSGLSATFQPIDSDLTAIAALSGTGIAVRTAADTWALRTLTAPAAGFTITNPAGIAGNMTFVLANDLAALEAVTGTGFAARTGIDAWSPRTITGTAAEITVGNGDGAAGNPTLSLPAALTFTGKTVTGGTYASGLFNSGTFNAGQTTGLFDVHESLALTGDISPPQITADQNDYNPTNLATSTTLRLNSDATRNITGLAGGSDGRLIIIHNIGATNAIVLKDENAGSTAANRFALTADITLTADSVVLLQYDSTSSRWRNIGGSGGGGGGASTTEPFVTIGNTGGLSAERALAVASGLTLTDGGANGSVTLAAQAGSILQTLQTTYTANTGLATVIPYDDTVPTNAEGTQILSQAITPVSSSNKTLCFITINGQTAEHYTVALFRGTTCIAAWPGGDAYDPNSATEAPSSNTTVFLDSPATTSATTYTVRVGSNNGSMRMNGTIAARLYGGVAVCTLTLQEIKG